MPTAQSRRRPRSAAAGPAAAVHSGSPQPGATGALVDASAGAETQRHRFSRPPRREPAPPLPQTGTAAAATDGANPGSGPGFCTGGRCRPAGGDHVAQRLRAHRCRPEHARTGPLATQLADAQQHRATAAVAETVRAEPETAAPRSRHSPSAQRRPTVRHKDGVVRRDGVSAARRCGNRR